VKPCGGFFLPCGGDALTCGVNLFARGGWQIAWVLVDVRCEGGAQRLYGKRGGVAFAGWQAV
jgi:hypothetical protein